MSTNNSMKRARSFSQPRNSENSENKAGRSRNKEGSVEKCVEDRDESEKSGNSRSRSKFRMDSASPTVSVASVASSEATTASTGTSASIDKPVPEYPDNKEVEAGNLASKPPQPKTKPPPAVASEAEVSPTTSTSSYYARVRTRADVARKQVKNEAVATASAPASASVSRKFEPLLRPSSKTVDIEAISTASEDVDVDQEVEEIFSFSRQKKASASNPTVSPTSDLVIKTASKSPRSPGGGLKTEKTSSDSLKVEPQEKTSRLSPFNRFRSSLVCNKLTTTASSPASGASGGRPRTDSTCSGEKTPNSEKRRFFYRRSRTGPLPGEEAAELPPITASNSTSNLGEAAAAAQHASENAESCDRHAVRAKSEFNPRTAAVTASTASTSASGSDYVAKDNYFLAAAKRWASYDKPNYHAPLTRINWNRSHRKFNYSRFLNYTRETFV